ncbi:MAG TPA: NAD(P)-dependent oxidoreductase [Solirubrobacterales bacterium]|nr:NAD(P)-dependent oxidoreductase [Solirubrobacterales bacterium]
MSRVGYIGLGIMGRPAAKNLMDAGHRLTVATRTQSRAEPLVEAGAALADTPAEVAAASEVVFLNLPDTPDVELVLFGEGGAIEAESFDGLIIDMSTIDPAATVDFSARLKDRGIEFVDAPVSGGEAGAIAGTLSVMAGGSDEAFGRALPYLRVIGERITHVGPSGGGQVVKACNQLLVASNVRAVAEAMVLAERSGLIDPAVMREAVTGGFADSKVLQHHGLNMLEGRFDPGFKVELHAKDARIVGALAARSNAPVEAFEVARDSLGGLVDSGRGGLDNSAMIELLREQAEENAGRKTSES